MLELPISSSACAGVLKVLADGTRLAVVEQLLESPKHVNEINEVLDIDQSLLSHHLRTLRDSGLVEADRDGKGVLYRLAPHVRARKGVKGIDLGCCSLSFRGS